MESLVAGIRIALSGIISAGCAGLLVTIMVAGAVAGPGGLAFGFFLSFLGALPAIKVAAVPAMVLGGLLWTAGASRAWPRRRTIWAGTGALAGLALYLFLLVVPLETTLRLDELTDPSRIVMAAIFTAAGAIAALTFRRSMKVFALFGRRGAED